MAKNTVLIINKTIPKTILTTLNKLRQDGGTWCDLNLELSSPEPETAAVVFPVHSCIVAAASKTFALLVDKNVKHAILSDFNSHYFSLCLNFIYGSEIFIPLDEIPALVKCAERLNLSGLIEICKNAQKELKAKPHRQVSVSNKTVVTEKESLPVNVIQLYKNSRKRTGQVDTLCNISESDQSDNDDTCASILAPTACEISSLVSEQGPSTSSGLHSVKFEDSVKLKKPSMFEIDVQETQPNTRPLNVSYVEVEVSNPCEIKQEICMEQSMTSGSVPVTMQFPSEGQPETNCHNINSLGNDDPTHSKSDMFDTLSLDYTNQAMSSKQETQLNSGDESTSTRKLLILVPTNTSDTSSVPILSEITTMSTDDMQLTETETVLDSQESTQTKRKKRKVSEIKRSKDKQRTKDTLGNWLEKNSLTMDDIDFEEFANDLGVPEDIRSLLEYSNWPSYLSNGKFKGTPRMAYNTFYTNSFKEFTCKTCNLNFKGMHKFRLHNQKEHESRVFCSFCGKQFSNVGNLNMHEKRHKIEERNMKCELCDFTCFFKAELAQHQRRKHSDVVGKETHLCDKCPGIFDSAAYLKIHEQRVHNKEKWKKSHKHKCDQCDYVGFTEKDVNRHKRNKHSNLKPHVCSICRRAAFKQRQQLYAHIRKQHGQEPEKIKIKTVQNMFEEEQEKPAVELLPALTKPTVTYQCPYCSYSTIVSRNLKSHMIIHSDERPFQCSFCSETFKRKDVMVRHAMRHHKVDLRTSSLQQQQQQSEDSAGTQVIYTDDDQILYIEAAAPGECEAQMYITQVDAPDSEYFPFDAPT